MSVLTELNRLQAAKADITAALAEKGVTVPEGSTLDSFGDLVRQIKAGSSISSVDFTVSQWTGASDPYTLTIPAGNRDPSGAFLYQVEGLVNGAYFRNTWAAFNTSVTYDVGSAALILTSRHKFAGRIVYL